MDLNDVIIQDGIDTILLDNIRQIVKEEVEKAVKEIKVTIHMEDPSPCAFCSNPHADGT